MRKVWNLLDEQQFHSFGLGMASFVVELAECRDKSESASAPLACMAYEK
jgi:hypothetical protein